MNCYSFGELAILQDASCSITRQSHRFHGSFDEIIYQYVNLTYRFIVDICVIIDIILNFALLQTLVCKLSTVVG